MTDTTAAPAAPDGNLPMPTTAEGARAELAVRKQDSGFTERVLRQDATATARWQALHALGYPESVVGIDKGEPVFGAKQPTVTGAAAARQELELLKRDPGFARRVAEGNTEAIARWKSVSAAAQADQPPAYLQDPGQGLAVGPGAEQRVMEESLGVGYLPAKATDYMLPPLVPHGHELTADAITAGNQMREWAATALMPKSVGESFIREMIDFGRKWVAQTPEQRADTERSERQILENTWGPRYSDNMDLVRAAVHRLGELHPKFVEITNKTGAGRSAQLRLLIFHHAQRLEARMKS